MMVRRSGGHILTRQVVGVAILALVALLSGFCVVSLRHFRTHFL